MPAISQAHLTRFQEVASRILETRNVEADPNRLARELLAGLREVCLHSGLDGVLDDLALTDDPDAIELPELRASLVTKLGTKAAFDPRGPRNAQPKQLADCVLAALGISVDDQVGTTIQLDGDVRAEVDAAVAAVLEVELAVPKIREDIIAAARAVCDPEHLSVFNKITAQLDDNGMRMLKQPKVPLHAAQGIQNQLADARRFVVARAVNIAIDRAKTVLAGKNAEAAKRLDEPITRRLTPRDVASRRAGDARASKVPAAVANALLDDITELARFAWQAQERAARAYGASQTFTVGELIEHPKFGRGSVVSVALQRIDVEFPDGKITLVHARK